MERETGVRFYPYAETCAKTVSNVSRLFFTELGRKSVLWMDMFGMGVEGW